MKRIYALLPLIALLYGCAGTGTNTQVAKPSETRSDDAVSLWEAVARSSEIIASELPEGSRVAIVAFESENDNLSRFIMEELAGALFDRGLEVADRQNLEYIFNELDFQMSGAVDDDDAKTVGKFFAADIAITGQLIKTGDTYRYRASAMSVEQATRASVARFNVRGGEELSSLIAELANKTTSVQTARYEISADKTPQTAGTFIDRGLLFASRGDYEMAIGDFTEALKLDSNAARAYTLRGRALIAGASDVAEKSSDFSEILVNVEEHTVERDILDRAMSDFTQAIRLDPQNAVNYRERGRVHSLMHDKDNALADLKRAIELNPKYAVAYYIRGNIYGDIGNLDEAIADFSRAIEINPNFVDAYNNRGFALVLKRHPDSAIADFDRAIELSPNNADAYGNRGLAHRMSENFDAAIADLDKAIEINPNSVDAYVSRGHTYSFKGDLDRAIADYENALRINPNNTVLREIIERARRLRGASKN